MKVNKHLADIYRKDVIKESELMKKYIAWFDSLKVNPLLSYFTIEDINLIHKLATSPAMHCDVKKKYKLLGEIMEKRGFRLIGGGTNRRAYECIYDDRVVAKVATDQVGFTSNLREYVNQNVLKPFCNKIFEVTPCGSLSIIEKVVPIKDVSEFQKYAQEIYDILYFKIRNNSIAMEDIGTRSMKNWGYRSGFGPVLLDYPTMYVADSKKRLCKNILNGKLCCGTLDYDEGFNCIVCSECGRTYFAKTIAKTEGDNISSLLSAVGYLKKEGVKSMKIEIINKKDNKVISSIECGGKCNHVDPTVSNHIIGGTSEKTVSSTKKKKKRPTVTIINISTSNEVKPETDAIVVDKKEENNDSSISTDSEVKSETIKDIELLTKEENNDSSFEECVYSTNIKIIPVVINKEEEHNDSSFEKCTKFLANAKIIPEVQVVESTNNEESQSHNIIKQKQFIEKFNELNSGIKVENVNGSSVSITDLAKAVNEVMTIDNNPFVSESNAFNMYMRLSAATIKSNNFRIDESNVRTSDTLINDMLRKISNSTNPNDDMFVVFFKLINNVKNTKSFFNSILSFWDTFIYINAFDTDETSEYSRYCIYNDMLNMYREIVYKVLEDYRFNIVCTAGMTYNISNILSIINAGVSQMKFVTEIEDDFTNAINVYKFVTLTITSTYMEILECEVSHDEVKEPEETIVEVVSEPSPVELYDAFVQGNEKQGTKNQQQRYGKKKNKKKRRH